MSKPKRYKQIVTIHVATGWTSDSLVANEEGSLICYEDYAALQAENERLKTERDHYQWASTNDGIACNERARENQDLENQIDALKAENERLRIQVDNLMKAWLAAKGVQP